MAGALGQRRFVGRVDAVARRARARRAARRGETPAASAPEDRLARQRLAHERSAPDRAAAVAADRRFTVSRACTAASAAPDSAAAAIVRAIRSALANGRAASWIDDDVGSLGHRAKRVGDRVLPPLAAGDDPQRLRRLRAGTRADRPRASAGSATIDLVDRRDARETPRRCARESAGRRSTAAAWAARRRSRWPRPPAAMIAVTYIGWANVDYSGASDCVRSAVRLRSLRTAIALDRGRDDRVDASASALASCSVGASIAGG